MRDSNSGERGQSAEVFKMGFTCYCERVYDDVFGSVLVIMRATRDICACLD